MKTQDTIFFVILFVLLFFRKSNWLVIAGFLVLLMSIPLFALHIFFSAERLTYYSIGFILMSILFKLFEIRKTQ